MLNSSPMLRSAYSHVKELLRKTLSKYKTINKERRQHRGKGRESMREDVPEENSETLGWRILREGDDYITKDALRMDHVWFPTKDKHGNQQRY